MVTDPSTIVGDVVVDCISMVADYEEYIGKLSILVNNMDQNLQSTIFTVEEYINFYQALWNYKLEEESIFHYKYLLHTLQCENVLKTKINLLPRNDLQKLKFLTSMMKQPRLVIISKFFDSIDFINQKLMWDYLERYRLVGGICIVISEDLKVLKEVSNKIYIYPINFNS